MTAIIGLIFTIAIFGFVVYVIQQAPIPTIFKTLIAGIAFFAVAYLVLHAFGLIAGWPPALK